jgi:hypothetical protein
MKKAFVIFVALFFAVTALAEEWVVFEDFYNLYMNSTSLQRERLVGTRVYAQGNVTNVRKNYSGSACGSAPYIVRIQIRGSIFVDIGTADSVSNLSKGTFVKVYGYFSDYNNLLIEETISLRNGYVRY